MFKQLLDVYVGVSHAAYLQCPTSNPSRERCGCQSPLSPPPHILSVLCFLIKAECQKHKHRHVYCICDEWLCIHEAICNTVIQVPWMSFKMPCKLQLFATVNSFMILAAIKKKKKDTRKLLLGRSPALSPLSRRNQSLSPWRNTSWHLNWLCHLALCGDWLCSSSFLSLNLQINSLCLPEISVQRKQTSDGFAQLGQARFCLFIHRWVFYTDWDEIWQCCRISQRKGQEE